MAKDNIEWTDATIYTQGEERKPRAWEIRTKTLLISVHHYVGCGEEWFVSCHDLRIERRPLKATDAEKARAEALDVVRRRVERIAADLAKVTS